VHFCWTCMQCRICIGCDSHNCVRVAGGMGFKKMTFRTSSKRSPCIQIPLLSNSQLPCRLRVQLVPLSAQCSSHHVLFVLLIYRPVVIVVIHTVAIIVVRLSSCGWQCCGKVHHQSTYMYTKHSYYIVLGFVDFVVFSNQRTLKTFINSIGQTHIDY